MVNKKRLIIETAKQMISDLSFNEMNIKDLTKKCKLSKSNFYYYFNSKEEMYLMILEEIMTDYIENLKLIDFDNDLEENLRKLIKFKLSLNIINLKIIKKEILSGMKFINKKSTLLFEEFISIFSKNILNDKESRINLLFLINSFISVIDEFIIFRNNKISLNKNIAFNEERFKEIKQLEDSEEYIVNNIFKLFSLYIKEELK